MFAVVITASVFLIGLAIAGASVAAGVIIGNITSRNDIIINQGRDPGAGEGTTSGILIGVVAAVGTAFLLTGLRRLQKKGG